MKVIYMKQTIDVIAQTEGIETAKELIESGKLKQTEGEITYLIIENEDK